MHSENTPMQYTVIFSSVKNDIFQLKFFCIFLFCVQSIDYGYMLEPPCSCSSNEFHNLCFGLKIYICIPQFKLLKLGF